MVNIDNQSAIQLVKNPVFHRKSKYIEIRFHYIRNNYKKGKFDVCYVGTDDQLADVFTKPLARDEFENFRCLLNVREICKRE